MTGELERSGLGTPVEADSDTNDCNYDALKVRASFDFEQDFSLLCAFCDA